MKEKHWINYSNNKEEPTWLANSVATAHVINSNKYMFNKMKDRSIIVFGTGKETKTIVRGDVMICHSKMVQSINFKDLLLVPNFKQNSMSIIKLLKNNFKLQA